MERKLYKGRFYNLGQHAVAIVASVTLYNDDIFDWAAYIGIGTPDDEDECFVEVARHGNKMSQADAQYYFGYLPPAKWRR